MLIAYRFIRAEIHIQANEILLFQHLLEFFVAAKARPFARMKLAEDMPNRNFRPRKSRHDIDFGTLDINQ